MLGFGLSLGLRSSLLYGATFLAFLVYRKVALASPLSRLLLKALSPWHYWLSSCLALTLTLGALHS